MTVSDFNELEDGKLRRRLVWPVIFFFITVNLLVDAFIGLVAQSDVALLRQHLIDPGQRLVTSQIIMALIGATTVQLGAIAFGIFRFLFPSRTQNDVDRPPSD